MEDVIEVKTIYNENPYKVVEIEDVLLIGNQTIVNQLSDNGRLCLKYIPKNLNKFEQTTVLDVKSICKDEFKQFNQALATRVRRGIRNLVTNEVIAYTRKKDYYWVNKSVIWK
jgi:hypothetical protein